MEVVLNIDEETEGEATTREERETVTREKRFFVCFKEHWSGHSFD